MRLSVTVLVLAAVLAGCGPQRSSATPAPSTTQTVLVRPDFTPPAFPLEAGWEPDGLGSRVVGVLGPDHRMQYINGDQLLVVCVEVEPHQWDWEAATTRKTRAGSAAATLRHGIGDNEQVYIGLTWQLKDGRWVTVESLGAISEAELVRYAASLHPGSIPGTAPPISFGLVPPGLHLQDLDERGLCLAPQDRLTIRYRIAGLCLFLESVSAEFEPLGEKVRVNGHDAVLSDDGTELYVFLDERHAYQVMIAGYPLDRETLLRVAAAVTIP